MTRPFFKSMTVLMAVVLLVTTLAVPVTANIETTPLGQGKGNDLVREIFRYPGLGRTLATGHNPLERMMVAQHYVRIQIVALTTLMFQGPILLQHLNNLTGKQTWADVAFMAVFGVFFRQIMMSYQATYTQALFTLWCMLLFMITSPTGIFATNQ